MDGNDGFRRRGVGREEVYARQRQGRGSYGGSILSNSVGLLDEDYRGEVMFKFYGVYGNEPPYKVGERIAQLRRQ